ncbi:MAG: hypothetical protein ACTJFN_12920, partial [Sphingobacterium sp.]
TPSRSGAKIEKINPLNQPQKQLFLKIELNCLSLWMIVFINRFLNVDNQHNKPAIRQKREDQSLPFLSI